MPQEIVLKCFMKITNSITKAYFLNIWHIMFMIAMLFGLIPKSEAQIKQTGLPLINNFPRTIYKASTQNWAITQNSMGFMYFANNDGLLEFDGQHWALFAMPNRSIVRSVLAVSDTIFVGAYEELGFFAPNQSGKLTYHSLKQLIPKKYASFDEIWKIYNTSNGIIFQSFKFLFLYKNGTIEPIEPQSVYGHSYAIGEDIYFIDVKKGLGKLKGKQIEYLSTNPLFLENEVRCILATADNKLLIGFINKGMYLFDGNTVSPWETEVNNHLKENIVFSGIRLSNGIYAFGTIQNGVYIANEKGDILQHINRFKGLLNNTVLSLCEDKTGNLWLGLDNGIDYIEINSPISIYNHTFHIESTYASIVFNGFLYVGTNQGLFYSELKNLDNTQTFKANFKLIQGTEGQVWKLEVIDNQLLCGHNFGCFQIDGTKARRIAADRGYWTFLQYNGKPDTLICGTYNGLVLMVKEGISWKFHSRVEGFDESSRSIVQPTGQNVVWIAHGYRGLLKVQLSTNLTKVLDWKVYTGKNNLPEELPYNGHKINNEVVFSTKKGFYTYDEGQDSFYASEKYNRIFRDNWNVENIFTDNSGNLWYFSEGEMGLLRILEDGTFSNITVPFKRINSLLIESYEHLFIHDNRNVFIGSKNGLLHYNPLFKKDYSTPRSLVFRDIIFSGKNESTALFNVPGDETSTPAPIAIPFSKNAVSFRYAYPQFEANENILFSCRLIGFDTNWSQWDKNTFKEYTNLKEGNYNFEVRTNAIDASHSLTYNFEFVIRPPFSRSIFAYIIYIIVLVLVVLGNIYFVRRRVTKTRMLEKERYAKEIYEQEVAFREQAFIAEKEIIHLRNEALENQVSHKNKELANTTLHLIHKNKILNAIKLQLNDLYDNNLMQSKKIQIEQINNKINKELKNEKFQRVFDSYFDDVHQDFINRLKGKHPELSARDLRLCAYLKMNLTTKEIAPLMTISVRGVEIGRYRLRKKLNLDRDENLIDYLLRL